MKPIMVITGASKGLGKGCADYFKNNYEIVTVHRSPGATFQGDLRDAAFRNKVVEQVTPNVFINNAGGDCEKDYVAMLELNGVAATDLLLQFYNKMPAGHIFNIGSVAIHHRTWPHMDQKWIPYIAAKNMIRAASIHLSETRSKKVKVTLLEPEFISNTTAVPHSLLQSAYDEFKLEQFTPMRAEDVARIIENELDQPAWLVRSVVELTLMSRRN